MKIKLIVFGKLKNPGFKESVQYYQKLIKKWVQLDIIEIHSSDDEKKFNSLIEEKSSNKRKTIFLDEKGKALSSFQWAKNLDQMQTSGISELVFCIGNSYGFSESMRKKADFLWSLGPQTFSHELARLVLMEQLYRTWSILKCHPYHHA